MSFINELVEEIEGPLGEAVQKKRETALKKLREDIAYNMLLGIDYDPQITEYMAMAGGDTNVYSGQTKPTNP